MLTILSLGCSAAFVVFFFLFANHVKPTAVAATCFVLINVFNFSLTSAFWSLMADIFTNDQARRRMAALLQKSTGWRPRVTT